MKALLITRDDLVSKTVLGGNVDTDDFIQFVAIAQDIHLQNLLGTDLLEKIQDLISTATLDDVANAKYKSLLLDYIKPCLIHYSMVEFLPFAAYTIANKGVYKHNSENSETVSKEEVDFLIEKERKIAEHYAQRFIDFMCFQGHTFPEYLSNNNGDMYPDKKVNYTNWML